eukprot:CAMPEP_0184505028 /NCGR_PEP_ID=MMETSP0113_2-20130426/52772_1 /TAXON_ID=91329 /ORGANISM="Norrisiella sphaerica, Strain BC52" /LENGTH=53 /DNA_ID=CAMNT_0026894695 /DNA_START=495 /DNA_END=656 /DNA_ORIENTATION=-
MYAGTVSGGGGRRDDVIAGVVVVQLLRFQERDEQTAITHRPVASGSCGRKQDA